MTGKKILFDGCSFTANSGFTTENQCKFHWPRLLSQHYQTSFENNAIGGSSNDEIFNRVVLATQANSYSVVFVQWSEIGRHWVYWNSDNIDDFTIINQATPLGFQSNRPEVQQYAKLHYTYFDNYYTNLKKWLLQTLALGGYLRSISQPYVFIKGFENSMSSFDSIEYGASKGFENMNSFLKNLLDFDHRSDDYIHRKVKDIHVLEYQSLFALAFSGVKSLIDVTRKQDEKYQELEEKYEDQQIEIQDQETEINNLEAFIQSKYPDYPN